MQLSDTYDNTTSGVVQRREADGTPPHLPLPGKTEAATDGAGDPGGRTLEPSGAASPQIEQPRKTAKNGAEPPPWSNTGVPKPKSPRKARSTWQVDYLAATISADVGDPVAALQNGDPWRLIEHLALPVESFEDGGGGLLGWQNHLALDGLSGAKIAWGGQSGTAYLSLSASALEFYADVRGLDVIGFIEHLVSIGARVTRLDLALDDHEGRVTRRRLKAAEAAGGVVTRLSGPTWVESPGGWTLYHGSLESRGTIVRIYDKAGERGRPDLAPWVRVEVELRGDKAEAVTRELLQRNWSGAVAAGVLRGLVDYREPSNGDPNHKHRWPVLPWWGDLLSDAEVLRFSTPRGALRTVEDDYRYLAAQMSRLMARVSEVYGPEALEDIATAGRERFTERDLAAIELSKARVEAISREEVRERQDTAPPRRDPQRDAALAALGERLARWRFVKGTGTA